MKTLLLMLGLFLLVLILPVQLEKKDKKKYKKDGDGRHENIEEDPYFQTEDDTSEDDTILDSEWLYKLQDPDGQCVPNPCFNNGVCKEKGSRRYKCDCPKPFEGKRCQKGPKVCKRGICGFGECVLTSTPPFYACKCKESYLPPDCQTFSLCQPNPCQNRGICVKDGMDFDCICPEGFRGRFCQVGPGDCYEGNGESYRGTVCETDDEDECLHWNSHFILDRGIDPFNDYDNDDGLGHHNSCRNPDGDKEPWCFIRRGLRLRWDFCDVRKCTSPTAVPPGPGPRPTEAEPEPTPPRPQPTTAKPLPVTTPSPKPFFGCGNPEPRRSIFRIYGGLKSIPGSQPWQLSLQVRPAGSTKSYRHICGAVLIDSCWALTAGHCIDKKNSMRVVAGGLTLDALEPMEQTIEVEKATVHESYRVTTSAVYNDIALLKLKPQAPDGSCAIETQLVKAACLPAAQPADGKECTISGWGATEDSEHGSNHLLDAQVLLISQTSCTDGTVYGSILDNTMFCAGHLRGGVDSCQGDSGGPLTCKNQGTHAIYGLVSWGDSCAMANKPGVYTRVINFLDWIQSKKQAA